MNQIIRIDDNQLDKLAEYFIYHKLQFKYGWTFEYFVQRHLRMGFEE